MDFSYKSSSSSILYFLTWLLFKHVLADTTLPFILWDPENPMFDESLCPGANFIKVQHGDILPIICGMSELRNKITKGSKKLFYNLYVTTDEEVFRSRKVSEATHLKDCKEEVGTSSDGKIKTSLLNHYDIDFSYSSSIFYSKASDYYFFTTSDGTEASLAYQSPKSDISKKMYFVVSFCKDDKECKNRSPIGNHCFSGGGVLLNGTTLPQKFPSLKDDSILSPAIFISFIIGVAVGAIVAFIGWRLHRRCLKEQLELMKNENIENGNVTTDDTMKQIKCSDKLLLESPDTLHLQRESTKDGDQCSV